jgi:hypothetical protein
MAKRRPTRTVEKPKAKTRRVVRRVVEEPEVEVVRVARRGTSWFGVNPWVVIVGVIILLLILFVPMFSATKTVEKTETIMVPERGGTITRTGYYVEYDYYGNPYYVPYTYYDQAAGSTVTVDPVDQIVQMQQTRGPDNSWVITLTSYDGTQVVHRDITSYDLTKTGRSTVKANKTVSTPYTETVPQQVTKNEEVKVRVNLINLIFGNY